MSELDLGQKLDMRRAFWATGASTRIDVRLGAFVDPTRSRTRSGSEDWTDLDVLGVSYNPLAGTQFSVADCKTTKARVTERVFWLRGVADLFGAQAAFLTRDSPIPESARQLALRLGITTLDRSDREAFLDQLGSVNLPATGSYFEADSVQRWVRLTLDVPDAIGRLQRYRQGFYWLVRRGRNLTALPTSLSSVARHFAPDQRWAQAILVDLAWLYLVAILAALDELTRLHLAEPRVGLTQAVVGSEQERREKEQLAQRLSELFTHIDPSVSKRLPAVPLLPTYFDELSDLVARVARRRSEVNGALRVLEFVGVESIANGGVRWPEAFPSSDPREAKLASDVVRFLVRAAGLSGEFVSRFDDVTAQMSPAEDGPADTPPPRATPVRPTKHSRQAPLSIRQGAPDADSTGSQVEAFFHDASATLVVESREIGDVDAKGGNAREDNEASHERDA